MFQVYWDWKMFFQFRYHRPWRFLYFSRFYESPIRSEKYWLIAALLLAMANHTSFRYIIIVWCKAGDSSKRTPFNFSSFSESSTFKILKLWLHTASSPYSVNVQYTLLSLVLYTCLFSLSFLIILPAWPPFHSTLTGSAASSSFTSVSLCVILKNQRVVSVLYQ